MPRFEFRLEPLLRLRHAQEDRARRAFLEVLRGWRAKEAEIQELFLAREAAKERCRETVDGVVDVEMTLRSRRFINVLFQRISEKRGELASLRPRLDVVREDLRQATSHRRVLEKLRERQHQEFQRDESRREGRELDEAGLVAHRSASGAASFFGAVESAEARL